LKQQFKNLKKLEIMRKPLIYLGALFAIVVVLKVLTWYTDYKNKEVRSHNITSKKNSREHTSCDSILSTIEGNTAEEKGKWLRANVVNPDDEFCMCVAERHEIDEDQFYINVEKSWDQRSFWAKLNPFYKKYTDMSFGDVMNINSCNCYATFLGFDHGKYFNTLSLKDMPEFTDTESCYSYPLIHGVMLINGLGKDDTIDFVEAIGGNSKEYVYFRVKNSKTNLYSFYNISDDPGRGLYSF
jgi:hypothetical protein